LERRRSIRLVATADTAEVQLRANPVTRGAEKPDESGLTTLATLATASFEVVERDLRARIATLEAQAQRHLTAIDDISTGVCFFDSAERLTLSNRRFAEIYRLAPDQIRPGATLR
jgi:PAS domain-containing protein